MQMPKGNFADPRNRCAIHEAVHAWQSHWAPGLQRRQQAGPARRLHVTEIDARIEAAKRAPQPGRQPAPTDRQYNQIRRAPQLIHDFDGNAGLPFDHVGIIEGRQEMPAFLRAKLLRGREGVVEIVPHKPDFHGFAAECPGLVDLLARCGDGHEDHAAPPEMAAGIGHALRVIAGAGAHEGLLVRRCHQHLAHRVEGAA